MSLYVQGGSLLPVASRVAIIRSASTIVAAARLLPGLEVGLAFFGDDDMRALNLQWRRKDATTDVLTFCAWGGRRSARSGFFPW